MRSYYMFLFEVFMLAFFFNIHISSAKVYDAYISRTELIELNPKYVANWDVYTRRPSRNSPYTFTANFTLLLPLYNNVSISIIAFERSNTREYKEGAFVIKNKLCEWLKTDKLIYPLLRYYGPTLPERCPVVGDILIKDLVIRSDILPSFVPLSDARLDFHFFKTDTKETMFKLNLYFTVVERAKKSTKKKH